MKTHILFCRCVTAEVVTAHVRERAERMLKECDADVTVVDDLCSLVAKRDKRLAGPAADGELVVMACHPRAVRWLLHAAGVELDPSRTRIVDLRRVNWATLEEAVPRKTGTTSESFETVPGGKAWFPVIDRDRCRNCRQCVDFCLFGVYTLDDEGRPRVDHPLNCKDNCPACARICPEVAIVFPKLNESPLNGDAIEDEALEQARVKVDVEKFLGDDVYAALKERRRKARARLLRRREDRDRAHAERARYSEQESTNSEGPT